MTLTSAGSNRPRYPVSRGEGNIAQRGMKDEDEDSPMSDGGSQEEYDEENEEENEEQDEDVQRIFKHSLKMPPYEHAKRKLSQLIDLMNGPYLDLAPHYQRGVVWTRKAMRLLIDSMWKGYYIPPVIFNLELIEDGKGGLRFKRTCVDGRQRLTSIRDFMNGEFPCWIDKKPWYFCAPTVHRQRSHKVNVLPESAKDEFKGIEVLCTEYKGLTERQEIELFQRVQLGKPLTKAEAFRATQGSWQEFAKLYERDFPSVVNLCAQHRASGFRTILVCFLQIYECKDPDASDGIPILRNSFKSIESFCSNAPALDAKTKAHLRFVFELYHQLVEEDRSIFENHNYSRKHNFSQIELIAVACLLSQKGEDRPKGMLKGDILALRAHLREVESDIRLNKPCWTTVWKFIDSLEHHRGAVDGSTVQSFNPKIQNKKSQAQPLAPRPSQIQPFSAGVSIPVIASRHEHVSNQHVQQQPLRGASPGTKDTNGQRATGPNLPNYPFMNGFRSTAADQGNGVASGTPAPASLGREQPASEPRQTSGFVAVNSSWDNGGNDGGASQGRTISGSRTPVTPSTPSSITSTFENTAATAGQGSMTAPQARKRATFDLGLGSSGTRELESKKARLMSAYVKQEKDA